MDEKEKDLAIAALNNKTCPPGEWPKAVTMPIEVKESIKDQTNRLLGEGYVWNPLLKFPRNLNCPCDSGKKFKHCHLSQIPPVIPPKAADQIREAMKLPEAVKFVEDPTSEEVTIPNA